VRRVARSSRPHRESSRRPGCPGRHEKGTRDIVQERAVRLCSSASAHDLLRPRKWNASRASRRVQVVARWLPMRRRIVGQRNRHRLVPASSGAKAPLACEDRTLVGCARASFQVAEVGKRCRGPEKRVSRWQRGAWTGAQSSKLRKGPRGRKGVEIRCCGGKAARPGKSGAGRSRGRCGAKVLARWKASRITRTARIVHAIGLRAVLAASMGAQVARATGVAWERRQGGQRYGPHASRWEDNAHRGDTTTEVRPTEANRTDVRQAMSPIAQAR